MTETQATNNTETEDDFFSRGLEMYNNKEPYDDVIDTFNEGLNENTRDSSYYTCLSWLHILRNTGSDRKKAMDYAKTALKFEPTNAQAQYNLVLSYLLIGRKGVREEFEKAISMSRDQDIEAAVTNLQEAIDREDMSEAKKLLKWIEQA